MLCSKVNQLYVFIYPPFWILFPYRSSQSTEYSSLCYAVCVCVCVCVSRSVVFETPWAVAHQASLSMGFSRQEYWSGLSCLPPGNLPDPGVEPTFLMSPALAGRFFTTELPGRPLLYARDSANTARGYVYTCVFVVVVKLNSHVAFSALQALFCALYKY